MFPYLKQIAASAINSDEVLKQDGSLCGYDCCPQEKKFGCSHLGEFYVKGKIEIHMLRNAKDGQQTPRIQERDLQQTFLRRLKKESTLPTP